MSAPASTPPRPTITHVLFDIGGVLGTNGWDREQRQRATEVFGLDAEEFEYRHQETVGDWESGRMSLDEYLDVTVFYVPRDFDRRKFVEFMFSQSEPFPDSLAIVRALAARGTVRLATLNNEAEDLNRYRIERFQLAPLFSAFCSSCWLAARKPGHVIYQRALGVLDADPAATLFVDDRPQNLAPARALGLSTLHFTTAERLERELRERGVL